MIGDVLQPTHLIFILVVALLVLGPKRLPEVGRSLGRGIRDFRGALSGSDDRDSDSTDGQSPRADVPPVTPATTSLSAEVRPEEDRHVFPAEWPPAAAQAQVEGEDADQTESASASSEAPVAGNPPVAPVANPFRPD